MARPTKHHFIEASNFPVKCVYVFLDGEKPVYVGRTNNAKLRFEPYRLKKCHNVQLNNWLIEKDSDFNVLIYQCDSIESLEVELISANKETLFNISNGKPANWYIQNRHHKPWVADRGILSHISKLLRVSKNEHRKSVIKGWVKSLTDRERCEEEIKCAMLYPMRYEKWLSLTSEKLINCMEST